MLALRTPPEASPAQRWRRATGVTLTELMVALAILAVLLAAAAPDFRATLRQLQVAAAADDFHAALLLARTEAIRRGARVDVVPSRDADWSSGWIVLVDADGDGSVGPGDDVILRHDEVPAGIRITAKLSDDSRPYVAFGPSGRTRTHASGSAPQFGTWTFSLDDEPRRRIRIGFLGRPRLCVPGRDPACASA